MQSIAGGESTACRQHSTGSGPLDGSSGPRPLTGQQPLPATAASYKPPLNRPWTPWKGPTKIGTLQLPTSRAQAQAPGAKQPLKVLDKPWVHGFPPFSSSQDSFPPRSWPTRLRRWGKGGLGGRRLSTLSFPLAFSIVTEAGHPASSVPACLGAVGQRRSRSFSTAAVPFMFWRLRGSERAQHEVKSTWSAGSHWLPSGA